MTTPTSLPLEEVVRLYNSGLSQKEIGKHFSVSQKVVFGFMRRNGIGARPAHGVPQFGEKNGAWKGGVNHNQAGYILVKNYSHPRAVKGYVPLHILVAEEAIGRRLIWRGQGHPETEIVHHKDGNIYNNSPENLQVTSYSKHQGLHAEMRRGSK